MKLKSFTSVPPAPGGIFDLDQAKDEIDELEEEMATEGFWSDQKRAQRISKQAADLREEVKTWEEFSSEIKELKEFAELAQEEQREDLHDEIADQLADLKERYEKLEFQVLLGDKYDKANAIIAVHAGSGGTEAQDWAEMLFRMIVRFSQEQDWQVDLVNESRGEEAGYKSVTFRVNGRYAYGYLQAEDGVHRLVRISPFDADKQRHTSFALVEVMPQFQELEEVEIDEDDLRIDTFASSGAGGQSVNRTNSAVRIVHKPTGIKVQCQNERSQRQNKETAMEILRAKLHKRKEQKRQEQKQKLRGEYASAEWGNQIRSYVLQPYQMVKDHRTDYESSNPEAVIDGELFPFIEAYLRQRLDDSDRFADDQEE